MFRGFVKCFSFISTCLLSYILSYRLDGILKLPVCIWSLYVMFINIFVLSSDPVTTIKIENIDRKFIYPIYHYLKIWWNYVKFKTLWYNPFFLTILVPKSFNGVNFCKLLFLHHQRTYRIYHQFTDNPYLY